MNNYINTQAYQPIQSLSHTQPKTVNDKTGNQFVEMLKDTLQEVNNIQNKSDKQTNLFLHGKTDQLHEVMIAAQKASISLETTVHIQQKMIDAYNEIMRMQI